MKTAIKRAMISGDQIKKVWATAHHIGISEARLRDIVEQLTGQRSIKSLTKIQAKKVIDVLDGKASLPVHRDNKDVIALATPGQLSLIEDLKTDAGWTDDHLMTFIKRYKRDNIRKLRRSEAGVVIKVLRAATQKTREVI